MIKKIIIISIACICINAYALNKFIIIPAKNMQIELHLNGHKKLIELPQNTDPKVCVINFNLIYSYAARLLKHYDLYYYSTPITAINVHDFTEGYILAKLKNKKYQCHITLCSKQTWSRSDFGKDNCSFLKSAHGNIIAFKSRFFTPKGIDIISTYTTFIPKYTFLIDYNKNTKNLLFRGNLPLTEGAKQKVNIKALIKTMEIRLKEQMPTLSFPKHFKIVIISFLDHNPYGEGAATNCEHNSLQHKSNIQFISWPFDWTVKSNKSPLIPLINKLQKLMHTKHSLPYIIYIHCSIGRDRTSIAAISYLLKNYRFKLNTAYIYGTTITGKKRYINNIIAKKHVKNSVRFYCRYLQQFKGYATIGNCEAKFDNKTVFNNYPWQHGS